MIIWSQDGYFPENLMVRTENDTKYYPLMEWMNLCMSQMPFLFPIVSMDGLIKGEPKIAKLQAVPPVRFATPQQINLPVVFAPNQPAPILVQTGQQPMEFQPQMGPPQMFAAPNQPFFYAPQAPMVRFWKIYVKIWLEIDLYCLVNVFFGYLSCQNCVSTALNNFRLKTVGMGLK